MPKNHEIDISSAKLTYSKPNTTQWICITLIELPDGTRFQKVNQRKFLKPGTVVWDIFSNFPGHTGLRREVISPWDNKLSGKRKGNKEHPYLYGYERIGNLLHGRDTMFIKL